MDLAHGKGHPLASLVLNIRTITDEFNYKETACESGNKAEIPGSDWLNESPIGL